MKDLTFHILEDYLKHTYQKASEQGLFMKLIEEVGEAAEVLNIRAGRKAGEGDGTDELAAELADIIHYAVAIAAVNGIDLEHAIIEKDRRASAKYGHASLEDYIRSMNP